MPSTSNKECILIGIAGGTGSGKTLVARRIAEDLGEDHVAVIQQDAYYKNLETLSFEERASQNFDHPDAIDLELLVSQTKDLLSGKSVNQPLYDFSTHLRTQETTSLESKSIIILEGILILYFTELREMMDIKVFVDTDADIRLIRRLKRDIKKRGRSLDSVLEQYEKTVKPMHVEFVEPSKRFADIIIPEGGHNLVAVDLLATKIQSIVNEKKSHR